MSDNEISEKIMRTLTALLSRAEHPGTPEPEAKLCMEQAQRLMLKHSISDAKASATQQQKSKIGAWDVSIFGAHVQHRSSLLSAVARTFSCRVLIHSRGRSYRYELIGREGDLAMVYTLFEHLLAQLDSNLSVMVGRTQAYKKSYILYFSSAVSDRLKELYDEELAADDDSVGTALVLANISKEVDLWIDEEYPVLGKGRSLSGGDYLGAIDGQRDAATADIFLPGARFESKSSQAINA